MTINQNLDRIAAEIGFLICDIGNIIYLLTEEKIRESKDLEYFMQESLNSDDIIMKLNLGEEYRELIDNILRKINPLESRKKNIDANKFSKLKENPPKFDAKELRREADKALEILIENGLFAYCIWLESENKEPHKIIYEGSLEILRKAKIVLKAEELPTAILRDISKDIWKTLLVRQLLERMLIYTRYRANSLQNKKVR